MKTRHSLRARSKRASGVLAAALERRNAWDATPSDNSPRARSGKRRAPVQAAHVSDDEDDVEEEHEVKPAVRARVSGKRKRARREEPASDDGDGGGPSAQVEDPIDVAPSTRKRKATAPAPNEPPKRRARASSKGKGAAVAAVNSNPVPTAAIAQHAPGAAHPRPSVEEAPLGGDGRSGASIAVSLPAGAVPVELSGKKRREEDLRVARARDVQSRPLPPLAPRLRFEHEDQRACCTGCASLAMFEAVRTSNLALVESLVADKKAVAQSNPRLAPDAYLYALTVAIRKGDLPVLRALTAAGVDANRVPLPQNSIARENSTGSVGSHTYSHNVRKVNVARGGKEGNMALVDATATDPMEPGRDTAWQSFRRAIQTLPDTDGAMQCVEYLLLAGHTNFRRYIENYGVYDAAESGNRKLTAHLVRAIGGGGPEGPKKNSGSGFNRLHLEVLGDAPLSPFKRVSVPKKATSNASITPIHFAAINPNADYIRALFQTLNSNDGDTTADRRGRRAVHFAAACDGSGPLEYLLSRNNDLGKADQSGILPIHLCAKHGKAHNVPVFARFYGGSLGAITNEKGGRTACHYAAHYGQAETLAELIRHGAAFDAADKEKKLTPLMDAARSGHLACAEVLVSAGAIVTAKDKAHRTALHYAAKNGHTSVVVFLLRAGADPNGVDSSGNGALHYAAAFGHLATVELLVTWGQCPAGMLSAWKTSPLSIAFIKGHMRVVDFLLKQPDSRLDLRDTEGRSLVHHALLACESPATNASAEASAATNETTVRQIEFLLSRGAAPGVADSSGSTPLHILARIVQPETAGNAGSAQPANEPDDAWKLSVAYMLVKAGAPLDALDGEGRTPLMVAIGAKNLKLASWLVGQRASLKGRGSGANALHALVAAGAACDVAPLWDAMGSGDRQEELAACAASVDKEGFTPLLRLLCIADPPTDAQAGARAGDKANGSSATLMDATKLHALVESIVAKCKPDLNAAVTAVSEAEKAPVADESQAGPSDGGAAGPMDVDGEAQGDKEKPLPEHAGRTALHFAAYRAAGGPIVRLLCASGADANRMDARGITPIAQAVASGSAASVEALLQAGADPNGCVCGPHRRTPLMMAATKGLTATAKLLLRAGALPNATDARGQTALMLAVIEGRRNKRQGFAIERAIASIGGDVNAQDSAGCTALHYALRDSPFEEDEGAAKKPKTPKKAYPVRRFQVHSDVAPPAPTDGAKAEDPIEAVIDLCSLEGVQMNVRDGKGRTPLHYAALCGAIISTMYLLQRGADADAPDALGNGALQLALSAGHTSYAAVLINKGADVLRDVTVEPGEADAGAAPETLSTFKFVVSRDMMGICYLLMDLGVDLLRAAGDALDCAKFQAVATMLDKRPAAAARAVDADGRTLFHILAACRFRRPGQDPRIAREFAETFAPLLWASLEERGVDVLLKDKRGRTALHLAAAGGYAELCDYFIGRGLSVADEDADGLTPLAHALSSAEETNAAVKLLVAKGAKVNALGRLSPPALLLAVRKGDMATLKDLAAAGADPNIRSPVDGRTALMEAASLCRRDAVQELQELCVGPRALDPHAVDAAGRTALHWLVKGSGGLYTFEDTELLGTLVALGVPIDLGDASGSTPCDYAREQASGRMLAALRELGAKDAQPLPAEVIAQRMREQDAARFAAAPAFDEVDAVADSRAERAKQDAERLEEYRKSRAAAGTHGSTVDPVSGLQVTGKVVNGADGGALDLTLHKVDVRAGYHGQNDFYRMQVIHVTTQDLYILWTRWGRVGETGMHQRTPFATAAEAEAEFCKVFKSKSGNVWQSRNAFEPKDGKYVLVPTSEMADAAAAANASGDGPMRKFGAKAVALPTALDPRVVTLMRVASDHKALLQATRRERPLVLGGVTEEQIAEAFGVLRDISELVAQCDAADGALDLAGITACRERMAELGQRFYSLIRHDAWELGSQWTRQRVADKAAMLTRISDLQAGIKMHLAAQFRSTEVNPFEYCYRCLGADIIALDKDSSERALVQKYFDTSVGDNSNLEIADVFAVRRRGEVERFAKHATLPNQMLLWHGSPVTNTLGLLSEGVCIAPPNVPLAGAMFGSGIYFADMFAKSSGYMRVGMVGGSHETQAHGLALLCRVALGDMVELTEATGPAPAHDGRTSTKGIGTVRPNPRNAVVTVADGVTVPLGPPLETERPTTGMPAWRALNYNEYVVYDQSRVLIRYAVLLRTKGYRPKTKRKGAAV